MRKKMIIIMVYADDAFYLLLYLFNYLFFLYLRGNRDSPSVPYPGHDIDL